MQLEGQQPNLYHMDKIWKKITHDTCYYLVSTIDHFTKVYLMQCKLIIIYKLIACSYYYKLNYQTVPYFESTKL